MEAIQKLLQAQSEMILLLSQRIDALEKGQKKEEEEEKKEPEQATDEEVDKIMQHL